VARTLLIGQAMDERRTRTYGRLLDADVLPSVALRPTDTTGAYLGRVCNALAERYAHVPFGVAIAPYEVFAAESDPDFEQQRPNVLAERNPVCVVFQAIDASYSVDAYAFDNQIARCNRALAASLIEHVRRGTQGTFDAFTAGSAYDYAEWSLFDGGAKEWWEVRRYDVAEDLHIKPKAVTWAQIRKHVRDNELRTPGAIQRGLGRHHSAIGSERLSLAACAPLVAALPGALRERAQIVLEQAGALHAVSTRMHRRLRKHELALIGAYGALAANPGLIIETSRDNLVTELLNDEYEYVVQDRGFGPNFALVLESTTASAERFRATLADLAAATTAVDAIAAAMTLDDPDDERSRTR
jgi:hypothetical protein